MHTELIRAIAATLTVISASTYAFSADIVTEEQLIPPNPEPLVDTSQWGGFYVGAYGGYSWFSSNGANPAGEGDGAKLGGYAGYNWQFGNNLVTGLEAFGGYSDTEDNVGGVSLEQNWDASLRARLGYAFDESVIYSFAGLAVTSIEAQALTGTDDQTLGGYTFGLGWETRLFENITGRIEYGFSNYDSENFSIGNPAGNAIDFQDQTVNVGIGFKY